MATITTRSQKGSPLTNNEVDANFTNLNTDKAELSGAVFTGAITTNSTIDGRDVAADGVTADAALPKAGGAMTGAITTNSTFDGRDVATDGTKLDGIESGATADQTAAQIKTAYESNSDTNAFTDADHSKLDGIEASADVTDTANVTAAGALMDSELTSIASVKALNQGVATGDSPDFAALNVNGTATMDGLTVDGNVQIADAQTLYFSGTGGDYGAINYTDTDPDVFTMDFYQNSVFSAGIAFSSISEAAGGGLITLKTGGNNTLKLDNNGDISFYDDSGNAKLFWDASAESLGIGTTVPSASYSIDAVKGIRSSGSAPNFTLQETDTGNQTWLMASYGGVFAIRDTTVSGSSYPFKIDAATPTGTLHLNSTGIDVTGTATMDGLTVDTSSVGGFKVTNEATSGVRLTAYQGTTNSNVRTAYVDSQEFVVSTGAPTGTTVTERFRIASDGSLSTPTAGISNVRFGVNAGNSITSGGNYNVVVGDEAGTAITTGDNNVAVGYNALATEDTGSANTAIGRYALSSLNNDATSYNTAVGFSAGAAVTTGTVNTLIGGLSGDALTIGNSNVAVGYDSLGSEVAGDRNVAIGVTALKNQTNASTIDSYNTAVGYGAGLAVTTGVNNTLIGGLAGDAITTGNNNSAVGYSALGANTTGASNAAFGLLSLAANTTASFNSAFGQSSLRYNTTGANNTAVGFEALTANTTGASNTAIGTNALQANTTGTTNVAFGMNVLKDNTTGGYNTALGEGSLLANTTASNNTAVGQTSMRFNTTGGNNTALGKNSLYRNTTADNNTAVGNDALTANTTGGQNVAMGQSALGTASTATGNTAVGYASLDALTTGGNNTAVGRSAGGAITTGIRNVCIGESAADHSPTLTTGNYNVLIGAYADATSASAQFAVAIGYDVSGAGGYTTVGQQTTDIRAQHGVATWATVSDQRYKKDIVDSTAGLSFINALQPRTFKYKTLGELPETFSAYKADSTEVFKNSDTNHGFIAQEVKAAIDADSSIADGFKLWDDREDGSQEVAEAALIPVLTKAIQELSAQVEALTARIETLEG